MTACGSPRDTAKHTPTDSHTSSPGTSGSPAGAVGRTASPSLWRTLTGLFSKTGASTSSPASQTAFPFPSPGSGSGSGMSHEPADAHSARVLSRYNGVVPAGVVIVDLDQNAVTPHTTPANLLLPARLSLK